MFFLKKVKIAGQSVGASFLLSRNFEILIFFSFWDTMTMKGRNEKNDKIFSLSKG